MSGGQGVTSASAEDYLAAIYALEGGGRRVIAARLAQEVGVSPPATTEAIRRLSRAGYVQVGRGKRLRLTATGRDVATAVVRRRRLVERWLTHALGLDVAEAREEAHRLEHVFSPQVEGRLAALLGVPEQGMSPDDAAHDPGLPDKDSARS
jgi:DtxR family Mn-dependent transcriptional regulator